MNKRRFKGFVVLDQRGNPIWGTMHPDSKKSRETFQKWNPTIAGYDHGERLVKVELYLTE